MSTTRLDIHINNKNERYSDDIGFFAIGISRKLGFANPADLLTKAFHDYDPNLSQIIVNLEKVKISCEYFLQRFQIHYKEDIIYVLRRPELQSNLQIDILPTIARRVIEFNSSDDNKEQAAVLEYLEKMKPADRAPEVSKMLEQYFVKTRNPYYLDQVTSRIYCYLNQNIEFNRDGGMNIYGKSAEKVRDLIDLIWQTGQQTE